MSEKRIKVYKEETEREIKGIERENSVVNRVISPVQTVNGKSPDATGNIEIDNEDVGAPSTEDFSTLEETVRGKQDEIGVDNKLSADLVDDTESENKFVTSQEKNDWSGKQDALSQTQLNAVNSGIDSGKVEQIATNASDISAINGKIPAQASSSNQLADKGFVNSSIQTQTAHFRGNWEDWANVPTDASEYPVDDDGNHEPTTNDYMVVQDASGFPVGSGEPALEGTWRFKYSGTWTTNGKNGWLPEYQVNETPLTSAQLAALNSGITDTAVTKLNGIEAGAEVNEIETVSVNGTPVTPDANKNVELTIPEGIKTLTTADYNYPETGTKTAVALWKLERGLYEIPAGVSARTSTTNSVTTNRIGSIIALVNKANQANITLFGGGYYGMWCLNYVTNPATGLNTDFDNNNIKDNALLTVQQVVDNVTSTATKLPLSANQGKVLKALVDGKQNTLTFDSTPTENSTNPVTSGGVFEALAGAGGVKTLTTADYNYPANNPTSVALWLLEPGFYKISSGVTYKVHYGDSQTVPSGDTNSVTIMGSSYSAQAVKYILVSERFKTKIYRVNISNGNVNTQTSLDSEAGGNDEILTNRVVSNSLSETSQYKIPTCYTVSQKADKTAFSGTDGSTAGTMGLVPAPATTDANKFLKADGTWGEAGGGGGGGIVTLTTADYNYPANNPDSVALWLLDNGIYKLGEQMSVRIANSSSYSLTYGEGILFIRPGQNITLYPKDSTWQIIKTTSSGSKQTGGREILNATDVVNALTSSSTMTPLSAYQGKILNDKIGGDLSNLTTTDKTSLIVAINELVSRVSALEGN